MEGGRREEGRIGGARPGRMGRAGVRVGRGGRVKEEELLGRMVVARG